MQLDGACWAWRLLLLLLLAHASLAASLYTGSADPLLPSSPAAPPAAVDCTTCLSSGGSCRQQAAQAWGITLDTDWGARTNSTGDQHSVTNMQMDRTNIFAFVFVRPQALAHARRSRWRSLRLLRLDGGAVEEESLAEIELSPDGEEPSFALVYPNAEPTAAPVAVLVSDPPTKQIWRINLRRQATHAPTLESNRKETASHSHALESNWKAATDYRAVESHWKVPSPTALIVDEPGEFAYAISNSRRIVRINLTSDTGDSMWGAAASDGVDSTWGDAAALSKPSRLQLDSVRGVLYVVDHDAEGAMLLRLLLPTGRRDESFTPFRLGRAPTAIALQSPTSRMFLSYAGQPSLTVLDLLDPARGASTDYFAALALPASVSSIALDARGEFLYVASADSSALLRLGVSSGARTWICDHPAVAKSSGGSVQRFPLTPAALPRASSKIITDPCAAASTCGGCASLDPSWSCGFCNSSLCVRGNASSSSLCPAGQSWEFGGCPVSGTGGALSASSTGGGVGFVVSSTCSSTGGYNWGPVTQVAFVMLLVIFGMMAVALGLSCVPSWQPLPLHGHSLPAQHCFSCVFSPRGLHAHVGVQFLVLAGMMFALAYDSWALSLVDSGGTQLIAGLVRLRLEGSNLPILDCLASGLEVTQKLQCMSIKAGSGLTLACGLLTCLVALSILVLSVPALRESDPFTPLIWRLSCVQAVVCSGATLFFSIPSLLTLQAVVHCGFKPWVSWYACAASTTLALYLCLYYRRAVLDSPAKSPLRLVQTIKHPAPPQELPSKTLKRSYASSTQRLETTNDLRRLNGLEPLYPGQTEETEMDRWESPQAIVVTEEDRLAAALGPRPHLLPPSSFPPSSTPSSVRSLCSPHAPAGVYSSYSATPSAGSASLYQISEDAAHNGASGGGPVGWPSVAHGYAPSAPASALDAQLQFQSQYQGALHNDDDASSYYAHHVALTESARMVDGSVGGGGGGGGVGSPLALHHLQLGASMPHTRPALAPLNTGATPTSSARRLAPVQSTRQATLLAQFRTSSNSPRPF